MERHVLWMLARHGARVFHGNVSATISKGRIEWHAFPASRVSGCGRSKPYLNSAQMQLETKRKKRAAAMMHCCSTLGCVSPQDELLRRKGVVFPEGALRFDCMLEWRPEFRVHRRLVPKRSKQPIDHKPCQACGRRLFAPTRLACFCAHLSPPKHRPGIVPCRSAPIVLIERPPNAQIQTQIRSSFLPTQSTSTCTAIHIHALKWNAKLDVR